MFSGMRIVVCLAAGLAWLSVGPAAAQRFSAWPAVLRVAPGPDSLEVRVIQVRNDGSTELGLRLYPGDFDHAETGEHRFFPFGEHARTCKGRLEIFPSQVTLQPGEQQSVRVSVAPGPGVCWSFVFAETVERTVGGINIGQRIGVKLFAVPPTAMNEGEVTATSAAALADRVRVDFEFRNTGVVPVRPAGRIELKTPDDKVIASADVEAFTVLPGAIRRSSMEVPATLPAGKYVVVTILDFGGEYLAGGQAGFQVR